MNTRCTFGHVAPQPPLAIVTGMDDLIGEYAEYLRDDGKSPKTIDCRIRFLREADRELPRGLWQASERELRTMFAEHGWTGWTPATYQGHIRGFFRWATDGDDSPLTYDPTTRIRRARTPDPKPKPVTDEELRLALERSDGEWPLAITLAAYGGLRNIEILALRRDDVTEASIHIRHGKGNKEATIPCHGAIWRMVQDRPSGVLVRWPPSLTSSWMSSMARKHFDKIGLPGVHMHRFRHWYGTTIVREMQRRGNVDPFALKEAMRHARLDTALNYVHIADEQRRLAISTLPILNGPLSEEPSVAQSDIIRPSRRVVRRARRERVTRP